MHGGATTLARRFLAGNFVPELVLATDMLDLTTFLALARERLAGVKTVLYMHENQLTYPLPEDKTTGAMRRQLGERDQHYAFINYASMLAADVVCFNSRFHSESWFGALRPFLSHYPEYNELGTIETIRKKSRVLPVGVDFDRLYSNLRSDLKQPPLILWNQRWEYDKNPEAFFKLMFQLAEENVPFRLAVCGQQYGKRPLIFDEAEQKLQNQIVHFGYADLATYRKLLWEAEIVVSTAVHEFFGISILEAIGCRTFPILPNHLSYPDLLPDEFHELCLYDSMEDALVKLRRALTARGWVQTAVFHLAPNAHEYAWQTVIQQYESLFQQLRTSTGLPTHLASS